MVSGSAAPEKVIDWAERFWGDFNVVTPERQNIALTPNRDNDRVLLLREDAQPQFSIDWLLDKPNMKDRATKLCVLQRSELNATEN